MFESSIPEGHDAMKGETLVRALNADMPTAEVTPTNTKVAHRILHQGVRLWFTFMLMFPVQRLSCSHSPLF
jgi:hypothetical protein